MSAADSKKTKKRKSRKGVKPSNTSVTTKFALQSNFANGSATVEELKEIEKLMDADDSDSPIPALSRGSNPYLGGERCLLCRCVRPDPPQPNKDMDDAENLTQTDIGSLSQLPLWVCPDCRKTVEEEEKRQANSAVMGDAELRFDAPLQFCLPQLQMGEDPSSGAGGVAGTQCNCEACTERRKIECEHEKETQELQQCWMELRHVVRCVYREAGTGMGAGSGEEKRAEENTNSSLQVPDTNKMKDLVHRLCSRDPHQLYQRLESQGREYVIEMKVRVLKQLTSGHKTPAQAKQFVTMMLEEYLSLSKAAKTLSSFLTELETEHLARFNLTWELHNQHLFQSIIYTDPLVQNSLPILRLSAASKEAQNDKAFANIFHRYLKFDDEMLLIAGQWSACQQLMEEYSDQQAALKAKQKMLKEDWEFFKAQRKLLEQQVMNSKGTQQLSACNLEAQFTETMRHLLQGTKPATDDRVCPNCNRTRCPCDECTIAHMITCGIISPEVQDAMATHHHEPGFTHDPSRYVIDFTPPSMSSTSSSSRSCSPVPIDTPHHKKIHAGSGLGGATSNSILQQHTHSMENWGHVNQVGSRLQGAECEEDDEDDEEEDDEDDDDDDSEDSSLIAEQLISCDDIDEEEEDDDDDEDDDDEDEDDENIDTEGLEDILEPRQGSWEGPRQENCDCSHCVPQMQPGKQQQPQPQQQQQQQVVVEETNQCQCHACLQQSLQQSGQHHPTSLPPQQLPTTTPPPAALHLYPHIHGSNLHSHHGAGHTAGHATATSTSSVPGVPVDAAGLHSHPLLHPHLYDLHMPVQHPQQQPQQPQQQQPKTLHQTQPKKHPYNLDIETHEALHEHIYHAYGEWDNQYDSSKLLAASHSYSGGSLGTELLPPPPNINGIPFVEAFSMPGEIGSSTSTSTSPKTVVSSQPTTSTNVKLTGGVSNVPTSMQEHVHTDQCFKNLAPINRTRLHQQMQQQQSPASPVDFPVSSHSRPSTLGGNATAVAHQNTADLLHTDQCAKRNPFLCHSLLPSTLSSHGHGLNTPSSGLSGAPSPHQMPLKLSLNAGKDGGDPGRHPGNQIPPHNLPHSCTHAHSHNNLNGGSQVLPPHNFSQSAAGYLDAANAAAATGMCSNAMAMTGGMGNVAVGTATGCGAEQEYSGQQDEDSVDDSCSEKSSSTSTSNNQKDGKYCDCCYCEFFGHSNPPVAPVSRNYAEIRDRLRLRLKQRKEKTTVATSTNATSSASSSSSSSTAAITAATAAATSSSQQCQKELERAAHLNAGSDEPPPHSQKDLEDILKYINGSEVEGHDEKPTSSRAAKRARQKQRKAEEKARREEEARLRKLKQQEMAQQQLRLQQQLLKKQEQKSQKLKQQQQQQKLLQQQQQLLQQQQQQQQQQDLSQSQQQQVQKRKKTKHKEDSSSSNGTAKENSNNSNNNGNNNDSNKRSNKETAAASQQSGHGKHDAHGTETAVASRHKGSSSSPLCQVAEMAKRVAVSQQKQQQQQLQQSSNSQAPPQHHKQQQQQQEKTKKAKAAQQQQLSSSRGNSSTVTEGGSPSPAQQQPPSEEHGNNGISSGGGAGQKKSKKTQGIASIPNSPNTSRERVKNEHNASERKGSPSTNQKATSQSPANGRSASSTPANQKEGAWLQKSGKRVENGVRLVTHNSVPPGVVHSSSTRGPVRNNTQEEQKGRTESEKEKKTVKIHPQQQQQQQGGGEKEKGGTETQKSPRGNEQGGKNKKTKKKNKAPEEIHSIDEIFMPKHDLDLENGDLDEYEREIEEFKRFCMDSTPPANRERLQVNLNLKDMVLKNKKSSSIICS